MPLSLSWDIFIAVFVALVVAYSFIIGKHESVKVIVAAYIAIVAVQGIESLVLRYFPLLQSTLGTLQITFTPLSLALGKLTLFIVAVILLTLRGGLAVTYEGEPGVVMNTLITLGLGIAKAGLLLSTLITYVAGVPLFQSAQAPTAAWISPLLSQSVILRIMLEERDLWFALPALVLLLVDILNKE
ncbi:hypothetical protein A3C37_00745 [Candidatus Peribacteria bacterium RIFCSPHIGHO2_02_FULL_53_20]|nr:MAG: hypothetical protein A3C37_00745 [Candidatus Peribacteria bacterium RIFCSPHIGHO2_02_FULL_53_20]OGJ67314.1 MAG: hypothetical protein A3B61_01235 [Candidatus Peribacteria bacterium RIFCSPLOWO2_01_FULL_53_10]OGJ74202.1 MAG: hypothetical protein A3G69_03200 [Candidatus Peribacteria bacterium RIFCSPLOWO2_12_FULL_53_10]